MKLLIHDYSEKEWEKIAENYRDYTILSDQGTIQPCIGCFGCWIKTPGICVRHDGFEEMSKRLHDAEEVLVFSKYTYGGFSSFVKNVFDRSIGYILPYLTVIDHETHHKRRYKDAKPFRFVFRGHLTKEDQKIAETYVKAVLKNLNGVLKEIRFEETVEGDTPAPVPVVPHPDGNSSGVHSADVLYLNCSLRGSNSNTEKILQHLIEISDKPAKILPLSRYLSDSSELLSRLASTETIVLGMPLYVDGIPSAALRMMESLQKNATSGEKRIYVVANMGFYESRQIANLLKMVHLWCDQCGYHYGGGLAIGAGEMLGPMVSMHGKGPTKALEEGLKKLSTAIQSHATIPDLSIDPSGFPRCFYILAANFGFTKKAKKNGLRTKDVCRKFPKIL